MLSPTRRAALALAVVATLAGYGAGRATGAAGGARGYRPATLTVSADPSPAPFHRSSSSTVYRAIVRCDALLTEDSAAHVKLVAYGHGGAGLVYRCERGW